jgi:hypothetical protein
MMTDNERICENRYNAIFKKQKQDKEKTLKYSKQEAKSRRLRILKHYSNGEMKCAMCGFSDIRCLSIDHINGDGAKHRKKIKTHLNYWIEKNNYPDGFQILCMNCQFIKRSINNENRRGPNKNHIKHIQFKMITFLDKTKPKSLP